ncbi:MAG TPA: helix-turn-helix domain-containing protein [Solirubrobacterales bacterium]|jgi:hypothetical protein|nr:helix-turn-helix domain-containing protein [Solirubrobacterales bacterium]
MSETAAQTTIVIPVAGRLTRDGELLRFVGRHGAVTVEQVMAALGVGRTAAYRRVAACVERGLLERLSLLRDEPSLLRATRDGLRYAGLGLPVAVISPGSVTHWLRCASVALSLEEQFGSDRVLTERELRAAEQVEGAPIASAKVGELASGEPRLHRPDLAVLTDDGTIAVEVELTPKAPRRLEDLIRAWRRASWVAEVRYLCAPGQTRRAVERAVQKVRAESRVSIEDLGSR